MVLLKNSYKIIKSILTILLIIISTTLFIDFFFGNLILNKLDPYLFRVNPEEFRNMTCDKIADSVSTFHKVYLF